MRDQAEFEQLFAAHANRDLTVAERTRLKQLAERDVARRGAVAEVDAVHEMLQLEVRQREAVMRPADPAEEADEGYQRLSRAAARAEERLRSELLTRVVAAHSAPVQTAAAPRRARLVWLAVAAIALIAVLVGVLAGPGRAPGLDSGVPAPDVLGAGLRVTTRIDAAAPELSWSPVSDATTYRATILDERDAVVLRRADAAGRSTSWRLSAADFGVLRGHDGQLFLHVIAFDRRGDEVARTQRPRSLELR